MLMFTLTTTNLPWFTDLTLQVPMQYCSLQHQILLLSPVTSTGEYCFCFGSIPSFFLELFLHWSLIAYWAPTNLGSSPFSVLSFCLLILFLGFSRQEYWSGLPFPSPVDHILSDDHYIYYCGQESLRRNGVAIMVTQQKSPKCNTWMQSQKRQNDLCLSPRQTIQYHRNPSLCPNQ